MPCFATLDLGKCTAGDGRALSARQSRQAQADQENQDPLPSCISNPCSPAPSFHCTKAVLALQGIVQELSPVNFRQGSKIDFAEQRTGFPGWQHRNPGSAACCPEDLPVRQPLLTEVAHSKASSSCIPAVAFSGISHPGRDICAPTQPICDAAYTAASCNDKVAAGGRAKTEGSGLHPGLSSHEMPQATPTTLQGDDQSGRQPFTLAGSKQCSNGAAPQCISPFATAALYPVLPQPPSPCIPAAALLHTGGKRTRIGPMRTARPTLKSAGAVSQGIACECSGGGIDKSRSATSSADASGTGPDNDDSCESGPVDCPGNGQGAQAEKSTCIGDTMTRGETRRPKKQNMTIASLRAKYVLPQHHLCIYTQEMHLSLLSLPI